MIVGSRHRNIHEDVLHLSVKCLMFYNGNQIVGQTPYVWVLNNSNRANSKKFRVEIYIHGDRQYKTTSQKSLNRSSGYYFIHSTEGCSIFDDSLIRIENIQRSLNYSPGSTMAIIQYLTETVGLSYTCIISCQI